MSDTGLLPSDLFIELRLYPNNKVEILEKAEESGYYPNKYINQLKNIFLNNDGKNNQGENSDDDAFSESSDDESSDDEFTEMSNESLAQHFNNTIIQQNKKEEFDINDRFRAKANL